MDLSKLFSDWLCTPGDRRVAVSPLSAALEHAGYAVEARLLAAYAANGAHSVTLPPGPAPWDGRRAHIGPELPPAGPGELWLDTVEIAMMALLPGEPIEQFASEARHQWLPHSNWFGLRPVAGWQYAGFLANAQIDQDRTSAAAGEPEGLRLLDPTRLLPEEETLPVLHATFIETSAYRGFFGKRVVERSDWVDAVQLFGREQARSLWTPGAREWAGGVFDLEVFAAIELDEIEVEDREVFEAEEDNPPPAAARRFFGLFEAPPKGAAFRSTVDPRDGLRTGPQRITGIPLKHTVRR